MATSRSFKRRPLAANIAAMAAILAPASSLAAAQQGEGAGTLEEVVVTAQRREQSLQEVPVSVEAYSGAMLDRQGFRNMEDLSAFSPTVSIGEGGSVQDQEVRVRGFGTTGNSLTLEQAVPIFVDGIHFGRQSMIKTAFIDAAQVEVLKGPQPVFFGMNATAGAFNIRSRMPTPSWEGTVTAEAGSNDQQELSFGVGGPLSETLGIRLAGIREANDGWAEHYVTGDKIPKYDHLGGRVILQWAPNERFEATAKYEASRLRNGADVGIMCLTGDSMIFPRESPTRPTGSINGVPITDEGNVRSILQEPPLGEGWDQDILELDEYPDCFESNVGYSSEGPYYAPPLNVAEDNSYTGALDIRHAARLFQSADVGDYRDGGRVDFSSGVQGADNIDSEVAYLDFEYELDNGIVLNWTSALVDFYRDPIRDNSNSPFLVNLQSRIEDFGQWSTELRATSPATAYDLGPVSVEWMAGVFHQETTKDNVSSSLRANVYRGQRFNWLTEDAEWTAGYATVTFNFLEDRASVDLGGRVARISKDVSIAGYGATWVYDVRPCAPHPDDDVGGGNPDPATCELHEDAIQVDPATARVFVPGADMDNLWTIPFATSRYTPSSWRSPRAAAVGLSAPDMSVREGPHQDDFTVTEFDPQVALRYRLGNNHSLYLRYAEAFKAAGYDTGQTSIPETLDEMKFDAEKARSIELGAKGTLFDDRLRYDVALFDTDFTDLQLSGAVPTGSTQGNTVSLNAGEQWVRGIEFNLTGLVTDQLTLGLSGAIMDAELDDFTGVGCSFAEFVNTQDNLGIEGLWPCTNLDEGTTDMSGRQPAGVEDWNFVGLLDYRLPVLGNYQVNFNAIGYVSSGTRPAMVRYDTHGDLNLNVGFGPVDERWQVMVYGRNLLEPRPEYNREMDVAGAREGEITVAEAASGNMFATYGIQFRYDFM